MSAVGPVRPSSLTFGTASTSAGAPSGRLAGIGRRWRPPGAISLACGWRGWTTPVPGCLRASESASGWTVFSDVGSLRTWFGREFTLRRHRSPSRPLQ